MDNFLKHVRSVVTTVDEFDLYEHIKPSAIMEYFQDSASIHADEIGVGYDRMKAENLCWVLNRLSAVIERQPKLGEEITITTYPHKPGLVDAVRDYIITDKNENILIRGTSRWCVLDIQSKRIRRCAPLFNYPDSAFINQNAVEDGNPQLQAIDLLGGTGHEISGRVNITDLDRNGHMNNARYADIVVNGCDFDFYTEHTIKAFDFNFLSEMKIGNEYKLQVKTEGNRSYFEATGNTRVNPVFRAAVLWE